MSLKHQFLFIEKEKYSDSILENLIWDKNGFNAKESKINYYIEIDDFYINYLNDLLNWVPSYNPSMKIKQFGLNYNGVTMIEFNNVKILNEILKSILDILSNAPKEIILTGVFNITDSKYEKEKIEKMNIQKKIYEFINLNNKVIKENGILLHLGI